MPITLSQMRGEAAHRPSRGRSSRHETAAAPTDPSPIAQPSLSHPTCPGTISDAACRTSSNAP